MLIVTGRVSMLIYMLVCMGGFLLLAELAKRGKSWKIRKMPAIEAIPELVGRATEIAKPIFWSPGDDADIKSVNSQQVITALTALSYSSKLCAKYGANLICTIGGTGSSGSEVYPLAGEIVRESYLSEGKIEQFKRENIRYLSERITMALAVMGMMYEEGIAGGIWIGNWGGMYLAQILTATRLGGINIGGTGAINQIPTMAFFLDYVLIGEEIYAAGAQLSGDISGMAGLALEDYIKYVIGVLIVVGSVLISVGNPIVRNLLGT